MADTFLAQPISTYSQITAVAKYAAKSSTAKQAAKQGAMHDAKFAEVQVGAAAEALAGGAYAYQHGGWEGVLDGALSGANIGGMVGGIAAPFFVACFAAGEHIWTEHGSQPIENLKVGDVVLSRDEFNVDGPLVPERIEETFEGTGELLLAIDGIVQVPIWLLLCCIRGAERVWLAK